MQADGYKIIARELPLPDIIINGKTIRIDLLVEKDGVIIPIECGEIQSPKQERIKRLKEKYGTFKHINYGFLRRKLREEYITSKNSTIDENGCISAKAIVELRDIEQRRIVLPKGVCNRIGLKQGDYIEVTIRKVNMVDMAKPFIVQIKDEKQRRIIIDKAAWDEEELRRGDYIEVIVRKIKLN